jgi:hypothetical protein
MNVEIMSNISPNTKSAFDFFQDEKERYDTLRFLTPEHLQSNLKWSEVQNIHTLVLNLRMRFQDLADLKSVVIRDIQKNQPDFFAAFRKLHQEVRAIISDADQAERLTSKLLLLWSVLDNPDNYSTLPQRSLKPTSLSYDWNLENDDLESLYQTMRGDWISYETTLNEFVAVFTRQPLSGIKPITWNSNSLSELIFFIKGLHQRELSGNSSDSFRLNYQRMDACFVNKEGKRFKNFKQVNYNLDQAWSGDKRQELFQLLERFVKNSKDRERREQEG